MSEEPLPPRQVTVVFDQDHKITAVPHAVQIFRNNQNIMWKLVSQVPGVDWAPGRGIVMKTKGAEPPYSDWPGAPAEPCGPEGKFYCVHGDFPAPGPEPVLYQYDINLAAEISGDSWSMRAGGAENDDRSDLMMTYDPDISNEPQP
jgi:hypothetical protein